MFTRRKKSVKRVLHVMGSLHLSGMETMLLSSYDEWRRVGYQCDVVATASSEGPAAAKMRECGYGVYHYPFRSRIRYLPSGKFISKFFLLCRSGYDVVHIHTEAGRPIFAALAKLAGIRTIAVTPHNVFRFGGMLRVRKLCERQLIRLLGGRFGMISESVRECEWSRFRIKGARVWNWLNTSHFSPPSLEQRNAARASLGITDDQFVVVSVGNCSKVKNHEALLRAIAMLPKETRALYLHIGREEEGCAERALAAELGIEGNVQFLGSQLDPLPFLWAADVFAMPSLYEGLGISAIEAIAAGVPLVCSHVDGLTDVAAETDWTIFTTTAPDSIARALRFVNDLHPSERRIRALSDSKRIRERFSMERGVDSIVNALYV